MNSVAKFFVSFTSGLSERRKLVAGIASVGVIACLLTLRKVVFDIVRKNAHLPPRLAGIPYFGSLFSIGYYGAIQFDTKIIPKYGPIVSHFIGKQEFVTLNDFNLLEKVMKHIDCIHRPPSFSGVYMDAGITPNITTIGEKDHWFERRKLILSGVIAITNKSYIDYQIAAMYDKFIYKRLDSMSKNSNNCNNEKQFDLKLFVRNVAFNTVFGAVFGNDRQLSMDDEKFLFISKAINNVLQNFVVAGMAWLFPLLKNVLFSSASQNTRKGLQDAVSMIQTEIKHANENLDEMLATIKNSENGKLSISDIPMYYTLYNQYQSNTKYNELFNLEQFEMDLFILFVAATDTTALTMESAILFAAKYPKLQTKIYNELKQYAHILKNENESDINHLQIELNDIVKCPMFRAFVHETFRIVAPLGRVSRSVGNKAIVSFDKSVTDGSCMNIDVEVSETGSFSESDLIKHKKKEFYYFLDETMSLDTNLDYIMHTNDKVFPNAKEFDPNRWVIKKNGKETFRASNQIIPFNIGSRKCVGEALAMKEIYAFLANLVLNYKIIPSDNNTDFEIKFETGITKSVDPAIDVKFESRGMRIDKN